MLITSQFSWGTFSFAQSHIRSIQLVTTANGTFIIPQVHRNPLFGLAHKFKGHRRGYNTCCNYLSCVPWGNPQDATSRARRKANSAHFIVLQVRRAQRSPPLNIFHPLTLYLLTAAGNSDGRLSLWQIVIPTSARLVEGASTSFGSDGSRGQAYRRRNVTGAQWELFVHKSLIIIMLLTVREKKNKKHWRGQV